jgi:hypothetical protein
VRFSQAEHPWLSQHTVESSTCVRIPPIVGRTPQRHSGVIGGLAFERGWVGTPRLRRRSNAEAEKPSSFVSPMGMHQGPQPHSLLAFVLGVLGDVELAVHQDLHTLLDVLTTLGESCEAPFLHRPQGRGLALAQQSCHELSVFADSVERRRLSSSTLVRGTKAKHPRRFSSSTGDLTKNRWAGSVCLCQARGGEWVSLHITWHAAEDASLVCRTG